MQKWIELRKKPIQIGKCSRGFIIPKSKLRLNSSKRYIIKIIEEGNYYAIPKFELERTERIGKYKASKQNDRIRILQRNREIKAYVGIRKT